MKIFLTLSFLSICSFILGCIFFSQADFKGPVNKFLKENGHYSFVWKSNTSDLSQEPAQEQNGEIQVKDVSKIKLEVDMGQVIIKPQSAEKESLTYKIKFKGEKSPLDFKKEGDLLEMSLSYKNNKNKIFENPAQVEIHIPRLKVPLSFSADIKIGSLSLEPGLYFNDFSVDMSAGEMKTEALSFTKGEVKLSAGELKMKSTDLKEADLSVSGGALYLEVVNPAPIISADVNAGQLSFGTSKGVAKNFTLEAEVSIGEVDLAEGYTKSGDDYIYGEGEGRVELEVDLGEVEVF